MTLRCAICGKRTEPPLFECPRQGEHPTLVSTRVVTREDGLLGAHGRGTWGSVTAMGGARPGA